MSGSILDRRRNWYVFRVFNFYRLTLAALLLAIFIFDDPGRFFGTSQPALFAWAAVIYMAAVCVSITTSFWRRPALETQAHIQAMVDIVCLGVLVYASGGLGSNLTILLVIAIAASSIMLPLMSALAMASLAFLAFAGQWFYMLWERVTAIPNLFLAEKVAGVMEGALAANEDMARLGVLGASLFIAALLTYTLAERTRRSEELARQRTQELLEVAEINQAIIQHLHSGVIVVDRLVRVRLINDAARDLLNVRGPVVGLSLSEVSQHLSQRLSNWLSAGIQNAKPFRQDDHLPDVTASFTHMSGNLAFDTLVFLEDSAQVAQRLQQIKLAALGRLTAGIAHEIRNPLASISHAAQLLGESTTGAPSDRRLAQIVLDNAKRANRIITDVLDMSKRDKIKPEDIELRSWLEEFCKDFLRAHSDPRPRMEIKVNPPDLTVRFDPGHLQQVLWNLCRNAVLHGTPADQLPRVRLDEQRKRPVLDIVDFGTGIPDAEARKIFEPFFTTTPKGTGLGLFISREMCEANRGQLQYLRANDGGSCFRISFAQMGRQIREHKWEYRKY